MKRVALRKITTVLASVVFTAGMLGGCGQSQGGSNSDTAAENNTVSNQETSDADTNSGDQSNQEEVATELEVRFGNSAPFTMHLYDNDTATTIAGYVGTSSWNLPVYERDDLDYSVLEYYDIPSRYEIPDNSVAVTEQKAGEVYYSDPNRIVLFYRDAEIEGEYTLIGYFDVSEEFTTAVEENPVLEGWGNKIIQIEQP